MWVYLDFFPKGYRIMDGPTAPQDYSGGSATGGCLALFPFLLMIVTFGMLGVQSWQDRPEVRPATSVQVAEHESLYEDRAYPALVGGFDDRGGDIEGTVVFGTGTVGETESERFIVLSVAFDGIHYDEISLPMSNVRIARDPTITEATVTFSFVHDDTDLAEWRDDEFTPSADLRDMSEVDLANMYFEGAVIILSPEEHARIYGK